MQWSRALIVLVVAVVCLSVASADSNSQLESLRNKFLASYQRSTQRVQSESLRLNREAQASARGGIHETSLIQLRESLASMTDASESSSTQQPWLFDTSRFSVARIAADNVPISVYRQTGERSFANTHGSPKGRRTFINADSDETKKAASEIEKAYGPKAEPVYAKDATIVPFDTAAPPAKGMRRIVRTLKRNSAPTYNVGDENIVRPAVSNPSSSEDLESASKTSIRLARMLSKGARAPTRRNVVSHKILNRVMDPSVKAPPPSSEPLNALSIEPEFTTAQIVQRRAYFDVDDASTVVATSSVPTTVTIAAPAVAAVLGASPIDRQIHSILTQ